MTDADVRLFNAMKKEWREIANMATLATAVINVYERMAAEGKEPGAEHVTANRAYFLREVRPLILREWAEIAGRDETDCPATNDFLVNTWLSWRKALNDKKEEIRKVMGGGGLFASAT